MFKAPLVSLLLASLTLPVFSQSITTFDVPGAQITTPVSITPGGVIVGSYEIGNTTHAFVRYPDGSTVTLDPPGVVTRSSAAAVNAAGQVMGGYGDSSFLEHGFLWNTDGDYTIIDVGTGGTFLADMNPVGDICGSTGAGEGFLRRADGTVTTFSLGVSTSTIAINSSDQIIGSYFASNGTDQYAFVRDADGTVSSFRIGMGGTFPHSINSAGVITGNYVGKDRFLHGFLRQPDGMIVSFTRHASSTFANALNASGTVAGYYSAPSGKAHGFVRTPNSALITIDVPEALGTTIADITDAGVVIGQYYDSAGDHGFIATK